MGTLSGLSAATSSTTLGVRLFHSKRIVTANRIYLNDCCFNQAACAKCGGTTIQVTVYPSYRWQVQKVKVDRRLDWKTLMSPVKVEPSAALAKSKTTEPFVPLGPIS
jgi:hypothetical protein